jgi:hypothetical protein
MKEAVDIAKNVPGLDPRQVEALIRATLIAKMPLDERERVEAGLRILGITDIRAVDLEHLPAKEPGNDTEPGRRHRAVKAG